MYEKHTVQYLLYHGLLVDAEELDKLSRSTLPVFKFMFTSGRWGYLLSTTALKVGINLGQFAFFPLNFGITFLPKSIGISKVAFCKGFVEFFCRISPTFASLSSFTSTSLFLPYSLSNSLQYDSTWIIYFNAHTYLEQTVRLIYTCTFINIFYII